MSFAATFVTIAAAMAAVSVEACRRESKDPGSIGPAKPALTVASAASSTGAPLVAGGDAGADAASKAAVAPPVDPTLRVVAEADEPSSTITLTADDRLVVTSGSFVYEAKADGSLALQGGPESYAPLFPGSEETLIGYVSHARPQRVLSAGKGLDIKLTGDEGAAFHVENGNLSMLDVKSFAKDAAEPVLEVEGAPSNAKCFRLPSFDDHTYARCQVRANKTKKITFHAKDANGSWKRAFATLGEEPNAREKDFDDAGTIGIDGALYVPARNGETVVRCTETPESKTACETLSIDAKLESSGAPTYRLEYTDAMNQQESRYWATIRVASPAIPKGSLAIERVVARSPADVWVVATARTVSTRVFLHSGPLGGKDRVRLPSDIDGRVLARNTKAPAPWVGHCDQVFVKVLATKSDAALDTGALKSRSEELKKMLNVRTEDEYFTPYLSAMVEGRLHDEHVAGVIVVRNDVEASVDRMERIVDKMIDKLATNPMTRPQAYCTLPVLTSILAE